MNRRAKKRISQPTDQEILDNWWLQKEFKAVKGSDGVRTLMPNQIEPGVAKTQEACANFHYMPETKFSLSAFLDSVNLSLMDIGDKTRELRDRLVQSQMEACSSLKKEEIEEMFMRQLSRFLVISRGYGWEKKYKAFKVEDVRIDSLRYSMAMLL